MGNTNKRPVYLMVQFRYHRSQVDRQPGMGRRRGGYAAAFGFALLAAPLLVGGNLSYALDRVEQYRVEAEHRLALEITRLEESGDSARVHAGLAHAHFFMAGVTASRDSALSLYQRGLRHAEQALELDAANPWARLWAVANTLKIFEIRKPLRALWQLGDLEAELIDLKTRDENFEHAAADRVLAIIYARSPGFLLGSTRKARHHFEEALRIAPRFPANLLLYAEFLLDQGDPKLATGLPTLHEARKDFSRYPLYEMIWTRDLALIRARLK